MDKTILKKTEVLWPTYIFQYQYKDFEKDKSKLVTEIYEESRNQNYDIDSSIGPAIKKGMKESKFKFLETKKPGIQKLKSFFEQSLAHMMARALPEASGWYPKSDMDVLITDSWYHITNDRGYHLTHIHPGSSWAGIFYVETGDCSLDEMNGINTWFNFNRSGSVDNGSEWHDNNYFYNIQPTDGTLVLFPSWVPHDACPYRGEKDRIVVSANTNFKYIPEA